MGVNVVSLICCAQIYLDSGKAQIRTQGSKAFCCTNKRKFRAELGRLCPLFSELSSSYQLELLISKQRETTAAMPSDGEEQKKKNIYI